MKLNIFIKSNCDYCKQIVIPDGVDVNLIDIDKDYDGYIPDSVPVMQAEKISLPGPGVINAALTMIKKAHDGEYKI